MIKIFQKGINNFKKTSYLIIATILITMGEMVFFSSNNIGIFCYMFISLYVAYGDFKSGDVSIK